MNELDRATKDIFDIMFLHEGFEGKEGWERGEDICKRVYHDILRELNEMPDATAVQVEEADIYLCPGIEITFSVAERCISDNVNAVSYAVMSAYISTLTIHHGLRSATVIEFFLYRFYSTTMFYRRSEGKIKIDYISCPDSY